MEQSNIVKPPNKQASKHSYGKYFLICAILGGLNSNYGDSLFKANSLSHSMAVTVAIIFAVVEIALSTGTMYFLVLWIMDLIRRRGKIDRPENKKAKLIVNIIFGVILLMMLVSVGLTMYRSSGKSNTQLTQEQSTFISAVTQKSHDFTIESDKVKVATQAFIDILNAEQLSGMHDALQNLVYATADLQPKINELKVFSEESRKVFTTEKDRRVADLYARAIDVRDRDNKKLSELATFGLTIDWSDPKESEISRWQELAEELSAIEKELQATQAEFQAAIQA